MSGRATDGLDGGPPPAIRVDGLSKTFGDGDDAVTAVDDVSFEIDSGTVVGLLGPNGAGKTTAIKSMLGLVMPDAGTVEVAGVDVHERPNRAYDRIGAILEGARNVYWRLTVQENLSFFARLGGKHPSEVRDRHERLLEQLDLTAKADTTVNELSRGMKQKVSLASTLARDVDVVFMDEPTLGLDVEMSLELQTELQRLAEQESVTIILCSHDMDVIEAVCDRVVIMNDGTIVTDESVDALLDLLHVDQYRVTVAAPLESGLQRDLERSFEATVTEEDEVVHVDVAVTDANAMYDLLGELRANDVDLRDVQSVDPDLEDAFLRIVNDDGETSDEQPAARTEVTAGGER